MVTAPPAIQAARPRQPPDRAVRWYSDYWRAVSDANTTMAWVLSDTPEQRHYADALQFMLDGETDSATATVIPLLRATDPLVQSAARVTYGALLSGESDWPALAAFTDTARVAPDAAIRGDAAGIEAWAPAFRNTRPVITFRDSVTVLPLTRASTGAPVIPVIVNGVRRNFWLDTGSSITILSSNVAAACGVNPVSPDTLELFTPVGRLPARPAAITQLQLGAATVRDAPAMIVDASTLRLRAGGGAAPDAQIDGVIGFDMIRMLDVTVDDAHHHVIIRRPVPRPDHGGKHPPRTLLWFGVPIVALTSETGAVVHLSLDTGAEETYGTRMLVVKTHAEWLPAERREIHGFGSTAGPSTRVERGLVIPSVRLFLGSTPLTFRRVFLYDAQYPTIFSLEGTLGSDVGRGGTMRIDMTNGRFQVTPE